MDKICEYHEYGQAFESCAPAIFYFPTPKYFTILFKFVDFLRSLDRFKVLIRIISSEFYMAKRKKFTKILIYRRGGRLSTHVQTVLTSLMSKLVNS